MENIQSNLVTEFQSMFGSQPNGDSPIECEKWRRLCQVIVAERDRLREQLATTSAKLNEYRLLANAMTREKFQFGTKEELMAQCGDGEPTIEQIILQLEQQLGKTA